MIERFYGEYRWMSNFHYHTILYRGEQYDTNEHAYQAMKTLKIEERQMIRDAATPGKAKRLGRKITLRDDWDDMKLGIMLEITECKFKDPELRKKLLATGDQKLVEGNIWGDTFWGVCNGEGKNYLGRILMAVRKSLKEGE